MKLFKSLKNKKLNFEKKEKSDEYMFGATYHLALVWGSGLWQGNIRMEANYMINISSSIKEQLKKMTNAYLTIRIECFTFPLKESQLDKNRGDSVIKKNREKRQFVIP